MYLLSIGQGFTAKGAPRPLTDQGADVSGIAWMPRGDSLVSSTTGRLWRTSVAGGSPSEPVELAGVGASWPTISPDGRALAYSRSDAQSDIWKIEADAVTKSPLSSTLDDSDPRFSPDGKKVVFTSTRSGHGFELLVSDIDGANQVSLASARIRLGGASWSPRGDRIAYDAQGEDGHWDVYVVDAAGGQPHRLTQWATDENVPRWSNDGQWIYFGSNQTGRYEIWKIRLDGRDAVQLTRNGGTEPFESRDGKTLYFKRGGAHGDVPVFAMPVAGGQEQQVLPAVPLLSWVLSGDDVFYLAVTRKGPRATYELRRHALASGDDRPINKIEAYYGQGLTISPDGKTALWSASTSVNRDLILIENFR